MKNVSLNILIIISLALLFQTSCKTSKKSAKSSNKKTNNFYAGYSKKIGYQLTGKENKKLIENVCLWLGTPYKYGGCTRSGTDCSCFVKNIYKETYGKETKRTTAEMYKSVRFVSKNNLKEGDILFFKHKGKKNYHVGIYISNNKFAHASSSKGVMINDLSQPYYTKWFYKAGRVM